MGNKSSNCSNIKVNFDEIVCKPMSRSFINDLYVTESSLAAGIAYLDREMTKPVRIQIISRLTTESE